MMYFEPIEDGDVRMVSLNYVKVDDQSIYQIGEDNGSGQQDGTDAGDGNADAAAGAQNRQKIIALCIPATKAKAKGV